MSVRGHLQLQPWMVDDWWRIKMNQMRAAIIFNWSIAIILTTWQRLETNSWLRGANIHWFLSEFLRIFIYQKLQINLVATNSVSIPIGISDWKLTMFTYKWLQGKIIICLFHCSLSHFSSFVNNILFIDLKRALPDYRTQNFLTFPWPWL